MLRKNLAAKSVLAAFCFSFSILYLNPQQNYLVYAEPQASSEDNPELKETSDVPQIVVTPSRYETPIDSVGSSVAVIDSKELEASRNISLVDVLREVPGLEVVQNGGVGRTATVFLRGADSDQTLVLIDGVRVNTSSIGSFDFADLKPEHIERVEVLKGPQSVLYGSEALGGVINIITKQASPGKSVRAKAEGGSFGTHQEQLELSVGTEQADSTVLASYYNTDGISAAAEDRGNSEADSYENITASTRSGLNFAGDGRAELTFRYLRGDTEVDGFEFGTGAVDDLNFEQTRDAYYTALVVKKSVTDTIFPTLTLGFNDEELEGSDPDSEFNNYRIDNKVLSAGGQVDVVFVEENISTLGYSFERKESQNRGNFDEGRDVNSIYAQHQYSAKETYFLTGGARYDSDSDYGEELSLRFTSALKCKDSGTRLHSSIGTGFKAPTFNELYFPNFGNPNLKSESSIGYDVGVEKSLAEGLASVDITFFHNEFDDLIAFDTETFIAENIEEARALGFEVTGKTQITTWLALSSSYTYTDSEDKQTSKVLARRPRHKGSVKLRVLPVGGPIEKLDGVLALNLVNSRRESTGEKMDNYARADLTFGYELSKTLRPYVRFENLFDKDYEEIPGFGVAGFSAYGGIELSL